MARIMPTLEAMLLDGTIPIRGGAWIDIYNHSANGEIAGTIIRKVSHSGYFYVTVITEDEGRDKNTSGNEVRVH